jgi:O-antigen/teichoic acid export membrane protein
MGPEFTAAVFVATVTFILTLLMGPQIAEFLEMMGRAILILPIIFVLLATMIAMMNADPVTTSNITESTTSWTISYVVGKIPGMIIFEVAGAVVGAIGGFFVRLVSSFQP